MTLYIIAGVVLGFILGVLCGAHAMYGYMDRKQVRLWDTMINGPSPHETLDSLIKASREIQRINKKFQDRINEIVPISKRHINPEGGMQIPKHPFFTCNTQSTDDTKPPIE